MKFRYLRAFIVLLAGLITIVLNLKTHRDVTSALVILLIVLIIFYFFATLLVEILQYFMERFEPVKITDSQEDEQTEEIEAQMEESISEGSEDSLYDEE